MTTPTWSVVAAALATAHLTWAAVGCRARSQLHAYRWIGSVGVFFGFSALMFAFHTVKLWMGHTGAEAYAVVGRWLLLAALAVSELSVTGAVARRPEQEGFYGDVLRRIARFRQALAYGPVRLNVFVYAAAVLVFTVALAYPLSTSSTALKLDAVLLMAAAWAVSYAIKHAPAFRAAAYAVSSSALFRIFFDLAPTEPLWGGVVGLTAQLAAVVFVTGVVEYVFFQAFRQMDMSVLR